LGVPLFLKYILQAIYRKDIIPSSQKVLFF